MVSAGDTDISLHIHPGPTQKPLTGGGGPDQPNPKWQDLSKSAWGGRRGGVAQTNSTQSAKIFPNLHFQEGRGGGGGASDQHS